mmetsp:Transcript_15111/g.22865  ORF Transcript_15111/g.22865 Transcript_15111/m.22865 type:complete len:1588 (+) Transcript_15111:149-4912(+)
MASENKATSFLTTRQSLILDSLKSADKAFLDSLVISETVAAPEGTSLQSLKDGIVQQMEKFSATRVVYSTDGKEPKVLPVEKMDIASIVYESSPPALSIFDGKLFSVGFDKKSQLVTLNIHLIVADLESARIFLANILGIKSSISCPPDAKSVLESAIADSAKLQTILKKDTRELKLWGSVIDDTAPVVKVNSDFSRPLERSYVNGKVSKILNSKAKTAVSDYAKTIGGNVSDVERAIYTAAFMVIMFRRTLEEDLVVSTQLPRSNGVFGSLTEQVYLRIAMQPKMSFSDLLKAVSARLSEAENNLIPFNVLAAVLLAESQSEQKITPAEKARAVLPFNSSFASVQFVMDKSFAASCSEKIVSVMDMAVRLTSIESGEKQLSVEYDSRLFHKETAVDTLAQFEQILTEICASKGSINIMEIDLLTPTAKDLVPDPNMEQSVEWHGNICACFDASAKRVPERTAVVFQDQKLNYAELKAAVDAVCLCLMEAGVEKGDVIGLYGHRSPAVVWAIMGILKAGASYTMMDPKYPTERIELCLGIAGIKGFLYLEAAGKLDQKLVTFLENHDPKLKIAKPLPKEHGVKTIYNALGFKGTAPAEVKSPEIVPTDIAVVTFTSGSTGVPKGVMGRHSSLTHFYPWMKERFDIRENERFSMCSGIAHDPLQRDIFTPLFFGNEIHIPTDLDIAEPGRLAQWTAKQKITVSCFTPAMGQLLLSGDKSQAPQLPEFRLAFFVGALLIKRDVQMLRQLAPNVRVINMYGSTETQRSVGYLEIVSKKDEEKGEPKLPASAKSHESCLISMDACKEVIPVGIGMEKSQMLVLNSAGKIAGIGELAEIYMRSPHIALGYIKKPKVTKDRFIQNTFKDEKKGDKKDDMGLGDRMYKTGDLGRYRFDGFVECCGRADDQIKIRGFRIELGEINATLSKCPGLQDNVVTAIDDTIGSKMLVGYLVQEPRKGVPQPKPLPRGAAPIIREDKDAEQFAMQAKKFLSKRLPHYMIPTFFIVLEALPLTANGKVNYRRLPAPERRVQSDTNGVDVTKHSKYAGIQLTEIQKILIRSWAEVLQIEAPGLEETFFELGGHSLAATQLTLKMRKSLPYLTIGMDLLFKFPTIKKLSAALEDLEKGTVGKAEVKLDLKAECEAVCKQYLQNIGTSINKNGVTTTGLKDASGILLTGATGFLGAFLARELLKRTSATIYCAGRGRDAKAVDDRVRTNLVNHGIKLSAELQKRLKTVVCDLSLEHFGLDEKEFKELADNIDGIVHNGAYVHWLLPYERLKPTNVVGTHTILKLASISKKIIPVHYVSTTSVFDDAKHAASSVVVEDDPLEAEKSLEGGYPQSKWMAERLLMAAAKTKGVPVAIYRPGYVTGDCERGVWNTDDFQARLIKGCIALGAHPFVAAKNTKGRLLGIDASPVDYVAESIVHIAMSCFPAKKELQAFHIVNPSPTPYSVIYGAIAKLGYPLKALPYEQWRAKLLEDVDKSATGGSKEANPLAAIIGAFSENWMGNLPNPKYELSNTQSFLKGSKSNIRIWSDEKEVLREIGCPSVADLVPVYLGYLVGCKFISSPPNVDKTAKWLKLGEGAAMLSRSNRK